MQRLGDPSNTEHYHFPYSNKYTLIAINCSPPRKQQPCIPFYSYILKNQYIYDGIPQSSTAILFVIFNIEALMRVELFILHC